MILRVRKCINQNIVFLPMFFLGLRCFYSLFWQFYTNISKILQNILFDAFMIIYISLSWCILTSYAGIVKLLSLNPKQQINTLLGPNLLVQMTLSGHLIINCLWKIMWLFHFTFMKELTWPFILLLFLFLYCDWTTQDKLLYMWKVCMFLACFLTAL